MFPLNWFLPSLGIGYYGDINVAMPFLLIRSKCTKESGRPARVHIATLWFGKDTYCWTLHILYAKRSSSTDSFAFKYSLVYTVVVRVRGTITNPNNLDIIFYLPRD